MKRQSLLTSIVLTSFITLTIVFTVVTLLINHTVYRQQVQSTQINAKLMAEVISFHIRDAMSSLTAKMMHAWPAFVPPMNNNNKIEDIKPAEQRLITLLEQVPNLYATWVVYEADVYTPNEIMGRNYINNNGKIYETFDIDHSVFTEETHPWYYVPRHTKEIFFDALDRYDYQDGNGEQLVGSISLPVLRGNTLLGVFGADILFSHVFSQIAELRGESARFLIDTNGIIVGAADDKFDGQDLAGLLPETSQILKNIKDSKDGKPYFFEATSPVTQKKTLIGFVPMQIGYTSYEWQLFLYVEYPLDALLGDTNGMLITINRFIVIGGLLFIVLLFLLVRRIIRPIRRLTNAARQLASGDLHINFAAHRTAGKGNGNEIDELQTALATMVQKLNQMHRLEITAVKCDFDRDQALENTRVRTEFFARMSHELRTPMNAVIGFARVLSQELLTNKQRKLVRDIEHSADLLINIVNSVLDLSRLDAGKLSLVPVHYDFHLLLAHLASMTALLAEKKSLQFHYQQSPTLPRYIYGDDVRLQQVLINLLNNAVKFTERGSVELIVTDEHHHLCFTIRDTGMGVKESDLPTLFDAFQQMNMQSTRKLTGSGLGLAICKSLVQLMGGTMNVDSIYGSGTTFTVRVPYQQGDSKKIAQEETVPWSTSVHDGASKILVVDDNETNLQVAQQTLQLLGIAAETVLSGQEAIVKAKATKYDLVFMDHMMPDMDGIEAMKAIRALGDDYQSIPIVALTANALVGAKDAFVAEGFDDFLSKPLVFKELLKVLGRFLKMKVDEATANKIADTPIGLNLAVLRSVIVGGERRVAKLRELFTARETRLYTIEVHSLKAVAATVNQMELSALAAHHERSGKAEDWEAISETFEELIEKYTVVIEKIKTQLDTETADPIQKVKLPPEKVAELFAAVKTAAGDFEIKPVGVAIAELQRAELSPADTERLRKVCDAAEILDYDTLETI